MERIMKAQTLGSNDTMQYMMSRKTMELNPNSKLVQILKEKFDKDTNDKTVKDLVHLFYETSLIGSGFAVEKPTSFTKRIYNMLTLGLGGYDEEDDTNDTPPPLETEGTIETEVDTGNMEDVD
jgi:molecular chaperone HtpG